MCVICVSNKGVRQPNESELKEMFKRNPDGAGYMFVNEDGKVEIHKGFMTFDDFMMNVSYEDFTDDDVVIYHFRISTQGGVNPYMCHPFPLTKNIKQTKALDVICPVGITHNGIIPLTTNHNDHEYSDTAHFIAEYMTKVVHKPNDLKDAHIQRILSELAKSKLAILDGNGNVTIIGDFIHETSGLLFSNSTYKSIKRDYEYYESLMGWGKRNYKH